MPRGARIGRNVKVAADVRSSDFSGRVVRSGESVDIRRVPRAVRPVPIDAEGRPAERVAVVGAAGATTARGKRVVGDD